MDSGAALFDRRPPHFSTGVYKRRERFEDDLEELRENAESESEERAKERLLKRKE